MGALSLCYDLVFGKANFMSGVHMPHTVCEWDQCGVSRTVSSFQSSLVTIALA